MRLVPIIIACGLLWLLAALVWNLAWQLFLVELGILFARDPLLRRGS